MKQKNIIAGVGLLGLSLIYGWLALQLPERVQTGALPPSFFPMIIAGLLIIFSSTLIYQGLFVTPAGEKTHTPPGFKKACFYHVAFLIYLLAMGQVGFVYASIPFFALLMVMFGEKRPHMLVLGSFGVTLFLYSVFERGLYLSYFLGVDWQFSVPVPKGTWLGF